MKEKDKKGPVTVVFFKKEKRKERWEECDEYNEVVALEVGGRDRGRDRYAFACALSTAWCHGATDRKQQCLVNGKRYRKERMDGFKHLPTNKQIFNKDRRTCVLNWSKHAEKGKRLVNSRL